VAYFFETVYRDGKVSQPWRRSGCNWNSRNVRQISYWWVSWFFSVAAAGKISTFEVDFCCRSRRRSHLLNFVLYADCWNVVHDVHGTGGVGHKVINLKECLTLCIMDRTCLAVDWHPNNTQHNCWTLKNPVTGPVHGSAGEIIHYELIRRCAGLSCLLLTSMLHILLIGINLLTSWNTWF